MNRTIVKFDPLSDTDWSGSKNNDRIFSLRFHLIFTAISRIIIRSVRFKLSGTSIYHFIVRMQIKFLPEVFYIFYGDFCKVGNSRVRHLYAFGRF